MTEQEKLDYIKSVVNRNKTVAELPILEVSQDDFNDELSRLGNYISSTWRPEMED